MERIAIRELRNQVSRVVRRARAGERLIITVDGVPAAEIGPVGAAGTATLHELIASGAVAAARLRTPAPPAKPVPAPSGLTSEAVLAQLRER
ncbi:MAG TPA: type II toxin-antitoxin system prevent-host-death family antitoxin [Candidatus Sulfotelmatobacter sp.]|nr:type II toxin-antitoxin system prevent-host-death family antitoxin [Candidatus Sulfotelmatobacter sp.]